MNKGSHPTRVHCQVENAPCYFNFRPRENQGRHKPKFPMQGFSITAKVVKEYGVDRTNVFWAPVKDAIQLVSGTVGSRMDRPLFRCPHTKLFLLSLALADELLRQARRHRVIIGSGCVAILILVGAVIGLGFWEPKGCPLTAHLASWFFLLPENSDCKLCPENWQRHGDKCYWISREKGTWNKSQNDCAAKDSQLAVIQKQVELDFIRHKTDGGQLLWIGVTTIPPAHEWSWVDGSPLNDTLLQVTGLAEANSCGMLKGKRVNSEACSAIAKWICETEVRLV
uniref:killer cell lectin-like receptor subfamily B member 1B allele B n=1 Tax=Podarcis muralis TaxID=64176 RepID=UPI00109F3274|nr:killer cell lectin-like receptor subfamily B member 1B allele B [Podarcis muralis]